MRAVAQLLAGELSAVPVRVAELCWTIHREPPGRWRTEYRFDGP